MKRWGCVGALLVVLFGNAGCLSYDQNSVKFKQRHGIAGTISGPAGVVLALTGVSTGSTSTDVDGAYSFGGLVDGSYTITPALVGWHFDPANLEVTVGGEDVAGANFTATADAVPHSISGTVSGAILQGVTVTLSGPVTASTTTDGQGKYVFGGLPTGGYTVAPSLGGYVFNPSSIAVTVSGADVSGTDFVATASAAPSFSISGTVSGWVVAGVTVRLSGPTSASFVTSGTGNYGFGGLSNGDYTVTPSFAGYTFAPGSIVVTVNGSSIAGQNFNSTSVCANKWCAADSVPQMAKALRAVWGSGANDIWAVGDGGTIEHWDGTRWEMSSSPSNTGDLWSISGTGSRDVWAAGSSPSSVAHNTLVHWDGDAWTAPDMASWVQAWGFGAVWDAGPTELFVGGDQCFTWVWDGSTWNSKEPKCLFAGRGFVSGMWGSSVDDVWAISNYPEGGYGPDSILHWNSTRKEWDAVQSGSTRGIWGSRGDDIWVGSRIDFLHWTGTTWEAVVSGLSSSASPRPEITAIWGTGSSNVWAVGYAGTVLHWDGRSWTTVASGTTKNLNGIWGSSAGDIWAVGDGGIILRWRQL